MSEANNGQDEKREHHNHTPIDHDDTEEQESAHFQRVINALRFYRYDIIAALISGMLCRCQSSSLLLWFKAGAPRIWIWILLDDVYVDFCRGTSASGSPVLLFTYIHFTRSWVGLKGRPCSQS